MDVGAFATTMMKQAVQSSPLDSEHVFPYMGDRLGNIMMHDDLC